jgi:VWFA-related protein
MGRWARLISTAVISALALTPASRAQKQSNDTPIKLRSELIQIDAVVVDKQGHSAAGLRKEDFTLLEDDRPQVVSFFEAFNAAAASAAAPGASSAGGDHAGGDSGRLIFIVFDVQHIGKENRPRLEEGIKGFVEQDVTDADELIIMSTFGNQAVFDRPRAHAEIIGHVVHHFLAAGVDYKLIRAQDDMFEAARAEVTRRRVPSFAPELENQAMQVSSLEMLSGVAVAVRDVPGRKIAVFVTEQAPSRTALSAALRKLEANSRKGGLVVYPLDPRGGMTAIASGAAAEATPRLTGGGAGVENPSRAMDRVDASQEAMRDLAAATGGLPLINHNDLRVSIDQAMKDNQTYYMLGFYSSNPAHDNRFRRIQLTVTGRPDLTVRTREGYVAAPVSDAKAPVTANDAVKKAASEIIPSGRHRVRVLNPSIAVDPKSHTMLIKSYVQIDPRAWQFATQGQNHIASFEVIGLAYNLDNKLAGGFSKNYNLPFKPDVYQTVMKQGINIPSEIEIKKQGIYNLRVVVINKVTGSALSASEWVESK